MGICLYSLKMIQSKSTVRLPLIEADKTLQVGIVFMWEEDRVGTPPNGH